MAEMLGTRELLSIGRFARVSGLTANALRHYDDLRLLLPAHVDNSTGYRYYHADAAIFRERLSVHRRGSRAARSRRNGYSPKSTGSSTERGARA